MTTAAEYRARREKEQRELLAERRQQAVYRMAHELMGRREWPTTN